MAAALQGSSRLRDGAASSCSLCSNRSPVLGSSGFLSPVQVQAPGGGGRARELGHAGQLQVRAGDREEKDLPFLKRLGTQIIRKKESGDGRGKAQEAASRRRGRKKRQAAREEKEGEGKGKGKAALAAEAEEDVVPLGIDKLLQRLIKATPANVVAAPGGTEGWKTGGGGGGSSLVLRKDSLPSIEAFNFGRGRRVDPRTVFVAGGLGQIGARISQKLLQAGFVVRAGVPDLSQAQQIAEFATQYGILSSEEVKRLNAVEFDFKNVDSIGKAVGNAGKAVVTVGPAEDGASSKVSTEDALRVLDAASVAGVGHFILVAEPGDGKAKAKESGFAFFANLFNLLSPKKDKLSVEELIEKISESDLKYTVLKTAPTAGVDDFAGDLGNVGLLPEGATVPFAAQVGRLQVAAVVEAAFSNSSVSENKVVEVVSSPSYSAKPIEELFSALREDERRPLRAAALAKAEAEERERQARLQAEEEARAAAENARETAEAAARLEAEAKKLALEEAKASAAAAKAQARAAAAAASLELVSNKAKELGSTGIDIPKDGLPSFLSLAKDGVASTVRKSVPPPAAKKSAAPPPSPSPPAEPNGVKQLFSNLFKQDTLYVDD